jgi:hypothetical protein
LWRAGTLYNDASGLGCDDFLLPFCEAIYFDLLEKRLKETGGSTGFAIVLGFALGRFGRLLGCLLYWDGVSGGGHGDRRRLSVPQVETGPRPLELSHRLLSVTRLRLALRGVNGLAFPAAGVGIVGCGRGAIQLLYLFPRLFKLIPGPQLFLRLRIPRCLRGLAMEHGVGGARSVRRRLPNMNVICSGTKSISGAHPTRDGKAAAPFLLVSPLDL